MKIGTLTLHRSQNYGGLLQAFALQNVLKKMGFTSEIIDYWYPGSSEALYGLTFTSAKSIRGKARCAVDSLIGSVCNIHEQKLLRIKRSVEFIKEYLSEESYLNYNALKEGARGYDAYICGSDQVWNPNFRAADGAFRLEFVPAKCKKLSYAASFGVSSLSHEAASLYGHALQRFDHISVRESDGVNIVRDIADRKAELVLDPTLLLSQNDWAPLLSPVKDTGDYILCYFLAENKATLSTVYEFQKKYHMPIYTIGYKPNRIFNKKMVSIIDAGPKEFLGLIAGASTVFTDSFHGTVFSIIFKKAFYSFIDTNISRVKMSSRIYNLANMFGLGSRICGPDKLNDSPIDFDYVDSILATEKNKSINFLKNSLSNARKQL